MAQHPTPVRTVVYRGHALIEAGDLRGQPLDAGRERRVLRAQRIREQRLQAALQRRHQQPAVELRVQLRQATLRPHQRLRFDLLGPQHAAVELADAAAHQRQVLVVQAAAVAPRLVGARTLEHDGRDERRRRQVRRRGAKFRHQLLRRLRQAAHVRPNQSVEGGLAGDPPADGGPGDAAVAHRVLDSHATRQMNAVAGRVGHVAENGGRICVRHGQVTFGLQEFAEYGVLAEVGAMLVEIPFGQLLHELLNHFAVAVLTGNAHANTTRPNIRSKI